MKKGKNEHELLKKLGVTALILAIYILGRHIPLAGIDLHDYRQSAQTADRFLTMAVGGDSYRVSVLALGISPYMIASVLITGIMAMRRANTRSKISMKKMKRQLYILTLILAILEAVMMVGSIRFLPSALPEQVLRLIAAGEMVAGAMAVIALSEQNKERGIGGQSVLILVNLTGSISGMLGGAPAGMLAVPLACAAAAMAVTLIMENKEFRMPVQRIFIHNIYSDKNYIPVKWNPIGVLPVVFSTAVFSFVQGGARLTCAMFPQAAGSAAAARMLSFAHPVGIAVYIMIIYILNVGLSMILLNPGELSDQLLRNNDSLCGICSGRPTKKYLVRVLLVISILSATVMGGCITASIAFQQWAGVDAQLIMLPSIVMMLTSILVNLYRELRTAVSFETYHLFL